jgi:hypothetical protein
MGLRTVRKSKSNFRTCRSSESGAYLAQDSSALSHGMDMQTRKVSLAIFEQSRVFFLFRPEVKRFARCRSRCDLRSNDLINRPSHIVAFRVRPAAVLL